MKRIDPLLLINIVPAVFVFIFLLWAAGVL